MCTYRRPNILLALNSLSQQELAKNIRFRVIIADNDELDSARALIKNYASNSKLDIYYVHAPKNNISIARNASLDCVDKDADWVVFIDDDEIASPEWLNTLVSYAQRTEADIVFGPVYAQYPDSAPNWMREGNYHSNIPERKNGVVQTGHTCNAILKWSNDCTRSQRFLVEKGLTGGEDTEYFFRLGSMGMRMDICDDAIVYEPVSEKRITYNWIKDRKIRSGQSYAYHQNISNSLYARFEFFILTILKIFYCMINAILRLGNESRNKYWLLRAFFHVGVIAAIFNIKEKNLY